MVHKNTVCASSDTTAQLSVNHSRCVNEYFVGLVVTKKVYKQLSFTQSVFVKQAHLFYWFVNANVCTYK